MRTPEPGAGAGRLVGAGPDRRLTLPLLDPVPGLAHGFTVRGSGLAPAVAAAAGRSLPVFGARQVHGRGVLIVEGDGAPPAAPPEGDALVTARRGIAIAVQVADCAPILVAEPASGWIGAVHAGWRGTLAGVLERALGEIAQRGARLDGCLVAIGPHIGHCCFEVGPEVVEAFRRERPDLGGAIAGAAGGGMARIDLAEANRLQAIAAGVPAGRIAAAGLCTACTPDLLESYRRSAGSPGRMAGFIAWGR